MFARRRRVRSSGLALFVVGALAAVALAAGTVLTIQIQETRLRGGAKFWAPSVTTVRYGEKVTQVGSHGAWFEVTTAAGQRGWIHQSAVTTKSVDLSGGSSTADAQTTTAEVSLAGKGFSDEVEEAYRRQNPQSNFAAVDRMERLQVSDKELVKFLREGALADWRGVQ